MGGECFHGPGSKAAKTSTATEGVVRELPTQLQRAGGRRGSPARPDGGSSSGASRGAKQGGSFSPPPEAPVQGAQVIGSRQ
jgi:hypothetical protein